MSDRAAVRNAADPAQVVRAGRSDRDREARFLAAVRVTLQTVAGRLMCAELLERAGLYASVFDHSGSVMNFKEGRRNFGLELRAWLEQADEGLTDLLDQERRQRLRADHAATDAAHTASTHEKESDLNG